MNFQSRLVGLERFCTFLNAAGRSARIVDQAEGLSSGLFSRDRNIIAIDHAPIDCVTLRVQGRVGPRQNLGRGSFVVGLGGVPLAARAVLPMQYHWIVRRPGDLPAGLATRLVQKTRGFFKRERVGLSWSGESVGPRFARDATIMEGVAHLSLHDGLEVAPEPERHLVRIIHKSSAQLDFDLFDPQLLLVQRSHAGTALLAAFERMAEIVKTA